MQLNELTFAGNAGRDAEERTTKLGVRIVSFSLCHTTKGREGDKSLWVTVKVFENPDRLGTKYLCDDAAKIKKGANVFVKGPISLHEFTNKDGEKKTSLEMIANQVGVFERLPKSSENIFVNDPVFTPVIPKTNLDLTPPDWMNDIPF